MLTAGVVPQDVEKMHELVHELVHAACSQLARSELESALSPSSLYALELGPFLLSCPLSVRCFLHHRFC